MFGQCWTDVVDMFAGCTMCCGDTVYVLSKLCLASTDALHGKSCHLDWGRTEFEYEIFSTYRHSGT